MMQNGDAGEHRRSVVMRRMGYAAALVLWLWFGWLQAAQAAPQSLQACIGNARALVTIGLPERHRALAHAVPEASGSGEGGAPSGTACAAYAFGNDYQILDWLETGKIDAAVVSPFVAAMFRERGEKPLREFFVMSTTWPFGGAALPRYRVAMQVVGPDGVRTDTAAAFDGVVEGLAAAGGGGTVRILVDSYLSAALPLLLDYTESRRQALGLQGDDGFWERFMRRLELDDGATIPPARVDGTLVVLRSTPADVPAAEADGVLTLSGDTPLQDVFVHSRSLNDGLFSGAESGTALRWRAATVRAWLQGKGAPHNDIDAQLLALLESTYTAHEAGFRKHRHFRFKLDELWRYLGAGGGEDDQFALILTGGGVKAAYQTSLIDHLYGKGYLANSGVFAAGGARQAASRLRVDDVIGTSGGALLGAFVMSIAGDGDPGLTPALWVNDEQGRYIGNFDVFPFFEMPRYLTLIVAGLLFAVVLLLARRIPGLSRWTEPTSLPAKYQIKEERGTTVPAGVVWVTLLLLAPCIIKPVNGVKGLEHVPAIAGLFYFAYTLIAIFSDNRLIFRPSFRWGHVQFRGVQLVLLVSGMLLTFVPFTVELSTAFRFADLGELTLATLLCCVGILLIFLAVHIAFAASGKDGKDTEKVDVWIIAKAFSILFLVPVIATLMVWLTGQSLFELSWEFWQSFTAWCIAAAVLLIVIGNWPGLAPARNPVKVGLDFLAVDFPRPTFMLRLRRYFRVTGFAALAFIYWNVIMAPAIYGNGKAKEYFEDTYKKVVCPQEAGEGGCDRLLEGPLSRPPTTNFVVSATSLENQRERYFVFEPGRFQPGADTAAGADGTGGRLEELLKTDPRWVVAGPGITQRALLDVVFASGSPFPVFPATRAGLAEKAQDKEWLVDGGFAHNVPIEAANALGARRVLVISSSPLHQHATDTGAEESLVAQIPGHLVQNVPRLFPYLFERSQVEDAVSTEELLVATLSPVPRKDWPALTDFKSDVVEYLLQAAREDEEARIGLIESWGPPVCELGGIRGGCQELKTLHASRGAE